MKSAILLFSAGATASLTRKHNICLLQLNAFGGCAGPVGQIPDGQCRVGGGLPQSLFQLDKSRGILTDGVGRGCYITPEASQLQCDDGRPGVAGFGIGFDGSLTWNGSPQFYACPVNDLGEYNVYSAPISNQLKCVTIALAISGDCRENHPPPPPPPRPCEKPCHHEDHECHKKCGTTPPPPTRACEKPCHHEDHECHKKCGTKPPPTTRPCEKPCHREDIDCHKKCGTKPQPHTKPPRPCEKPCHREDIDCHKKCGTIPPPTTRPCEKPCRHGDHECYRNCGLLTPPTPRPCEKPCDHEDHECYKKCGMLPPPTPKPCDKPCHREDVECHKKCATKPSPPPKKCEKPCHGEAHECRKACGLEPPKPKPQPKPCSKPCDKGDYQCHKKCGSLPPEPPKCSECHHKDFECHKACGAWKKPSWHDKRTDSLSFDGNSSTSVAEDVSDQPVEPTEPEIEERDCGLECKGMKADEVLDDVRTCKLTCVLEPDSDFQEKLHADQQKPKCACKRGDTSCKANCFLDSEKTKFEHLGHTQFGYNREPQNVQLGCKTCGHGHDIHTEGSKPSLGGGKSENPRPQGPKPGESKPNGPKPGNWSPEKPKTCMQCGDKSKDHPECHHCHHDIPPPPSSPTPKPCHKCAQEHPDHPGCEHCHSHPPLPPPPTPRPCHKCVQEHEGHPECHHCHHNIPPPPSSPTPKPCHKCAQEHQDHPDCGHCHNYPPRPSHTIPPPPHRPPPPPVPESPPPKPCHICGHEDDCQHCQHHGGPPRPAPPAPIPPPGSCPADLAGEFQFPHALVRVDASRPREVCAGRPGEAQVTAGKVSTVFNFDIPAWWAGKTCSLVFLFPPADALRDAWFAFEPTWGVADFSVLARPADAATTFDNMPPVWEDFGEFSLFPGNAYVIKTHECPAGKSVGIEMSGRSKDGYGFDLSFFQNYSPVPIGLYIRAC